MSIEFLAIKPEEVKMYFPEFYAPRKLFFEINKQGNPIGFFGIKKIGKKVGEISVYFNEQDRREITKGVATSCLRFPFSLGYRKILIGTKLKKMERFLRKMTKLGAQYLTQHNDMHWFEVQYEF